MVLEFITKKCSTGNQIYNSLAHLIKAQAPLNYQQLKRFGMSVKPEDDLGRFRKGVKNMNLEMN